MTQEQQATAYMVRLAELARPGDVSSLDVEWGTGGGSGYGWSGTLRGGILTVLYESTSPNHDGSKKTMLALPVEQALKLKDPTAIGGQALADAVAEVLKDHPKGMHLEALYATLMAQGTTVNGKDPVNTIIAVMARDKRFTRLRPRSGIWKLATRPRRTK